MKKSLMRVVLAGCTFGLLLLAGCATESRTSSRVEDTGAGDSTGTDAGSGDAAATSAPARATSSRRPPSRHSAAASTPRPPTHAATRGCRTTATSPATPAATLPASAGSRRCRGREAALRLRLNPVLEPGTRLIRTEPMELRRARGSSRQRKGERPGRRSAPPYDGRRTRSHQPMKQIWPSSEETMATAR